MQPWLGRRWYDAVFWSSFIGFTFGHSLVWRQSDHGKKPLEQCREDHAVDEKTEFRMQTTRLTRAPPVVLCRYVASHPIGR